jgi:hypothetical protein
VITHPRRRITVVLHDKPQSQHLLELGASIASLLQAELEGVFVEDAALFRLTGLPFLRELKRNSHTEERLDADRLLQEWRALAQAAQQALENSANAAGLDWRFRIWRGDFDNSMKELALESEMLLLGRLGSLATSRLPARRQSPRQPERHMKIGVILDDGKDAGHLLDAICELARKPGIQLILFLMPDAAEETGRALETRLREIDPQHHNIILHLSEREPTVVATRLKAAACDLLMISEGSDLLQGETMIQRLKGLPYPVVVVRQQTAYA